MKKTFIIFMCALVSMMSCTKSKEIHPEIGDGNDEIIMVGTKDVYVKYTQMNIADLRKVIFHYSLYEVQQFDTAEMTKNTEFFELILDDLLSDTSYIYYYELFPNSGSVYKSETKTFHTLEFVLPDSLGMEYPIVITTEVNEVTTNSAVCGGEVTYDGGSEVTECGFCWGINENPTFADNYFVVGSGIGSFSSIITGLETNTTYHVRAYATNGVGTAYGMDNAFTTLVDANVGAIDGLFTINENGNQVYFSQGNLQYQATTNTWCFAENQFDFIGYDNKYISQTFDGKIDMFGWGTSGWNSGNTYYRPWDSFSGSYEWESCLYGPYGQFDLTDSYANADWGVYNPIINGGNIINIWRTLTMDEWDYVFNNRNTSSGIRYAKAQLNTANGLVNGVILLPDDWDDSICFLNNTNNSGADFSSNEILVSQWVALENAGAVFLPAAGKRFGTSVYDLRRWGIYWSSSCYSDGGARALAIGEAYISITNGEGRDTGCSVRLVRSAEKN